jgi:hypothetical protein
LFCAGFSPSPSSDDAIGGCQWEVHALSAGICVEPIASVECRRRVSPLGRGEYAYDVELYASAKMFASAKTLIYLLMQPFGFKPFVTLLHKTNV